AVIDLWDTSGSQPILVGSTTTNATDGTYSFTLPRPGSYKVSTEINDGAKVNVPGRIQFGTDADPAHLPFTVPVKDQTGKVLTLYQLGDLGNGPLVASGDFNGDGNRDVATLAVDAGNWSATTPANLYLVIYKGGDLPAHVTAQ